VPAPRLLNDFSESIRCSINDLEESAPVEDIQRCHDASHEDLLGTSSTQLDSWVAIGNVQSPLASQYEISLEEEVLDCFSVLKARLSHHGLHLTNISFINLYISSMDQFSRINNVYSTFFGSSPPARACVGVVLPSPYRVRLESIAFHDKHPGERKALHVQGLSYWAPANIGPYSQAITTGDRIFLSGQIGMLPHNLCLPRGSLSLETALSFQHVDSILRLQSDGPVLIQGAICWCIDSSQVSKIANAWGIYDSRCGNIPILFIVTCALPKNAKIETLVMAHTGHSRDRNEDDEPLALRPIISRESSAAGNWTWQLSSFDIGNAGFGVITFNIEGIDDVAARLADANAQSLSACFFYCVGAAAIPASSNANTSRYTTHLSIIQTLFKGVHVAITQVPVLRLSTNGSDSWQFAVRLIKV